MGKAKGSTCQETKVHDWCTHPMEGFCKFTFLSVIQKDPNFHDIIKGLGKEKECKKKGEVVNKGQGECCK